MTTIHEALALAARLARQAEDDGIAVGYVALYGGRDLASLTLFAADNALTAALAMSVGAGRRDVHEKPSPDGRYIEAFRATVDGVCVTVQGSIPTPLAVVVDTDTAEVLTEPMPRDEADRVVALTTGRRVHVDATRYTGSETPTVGAMASHKTRDLDPRPVVRVSGDGLAIEAVSV